MSTDDGTHECPYPGCTERLPRHLLACRPHWRIVPGSTKYVVVDAWKGGRMAEYLEARRSAVASMEAHAARAHGREARR